MTSRFSKQAIDCRRLLSNAVDSPRRPADRLRRRGFTLVELLTVCAIAGILMTMVGLSLNQARNVARRTKAQAELRAMVDAWLQYLQLYQDSERDFWPGDMTDTDVDYDLLKPLIAPDDAKEDNPRQIMFLNVQMPAGATYADKYYDPWKKHAYRISFKRVADEEFESTIAMRTSVSFPNRERRWP